MDWKFKAGDIVEFFNEETNQIEYGEAQIINLYRQRETTNPTCLIRFLNSQKKIPMNELKKCNDGNIINLFNDIEFIQEQDEINGEIKIFYYCQHKTKENTNKLKPESKLMKFIKNIFKN